MTDLARMIAAFQRGDTEFETLDAAIAQALADNPARVEEIRSLLDRARDKGLPKHVHAALAGNLDLAAATESTRTVRTVPMSGSDVSDKTLVLDGDKGEPKTVPLPGSVADNARRLEKDSESTEHTLMTYLGSDFTARETGSQSGATTPGDIFKRPFTEDEIAGADVTALQGIDTSAARSGEFGPGYMLRGRFQLTTKLGEGGMGAVWRARDMLKVRARDRNPYVAIKLLSGDFREHPEAFIALQRETSKQQRLAHPNVATVFDFDRDESTTTVFMTMEAMEGQSMDKFIKKLPTEGLAIDEAMPIVEQLGAGLSYAHQNGLVHSDLKPGNCFVTKDGVVKLLDFGIARASKTEAQAGGEKTLFDPGKLGAITPTYATVEMFDGLDPDPRDDIYALAIMTYQLFTGKHPYGKQNAVKAMAMGLQVPYVSKLSKRQNRGLARGLAFKREDRTETVEQFLEDVRPRKSRVALYASAGLAAVLFIGLLAYEPVMDVVRTRENESIIAQLETGTLEGVRNALSRVRALKSFEQKSAVMEDSRTLGAIAALLAGGNDAQTNEVLSLIEGLGGRQRQEVVNAPAVRGAIFEVFEQRIAEAFDPAKNALDYDAANQSLQKLDALYPQSAAVLSIETALKKQKDDLIASLAEQFEDLLERGAIIASEDETDVIDVLGQIRTLSPTHPLLADDRLRFRAAELAERALKENDAVTAERYVSAGLAIAPDDATLKNLGHRARTTSERIEREKLMATISTRLRNAESSLTSLEAFSPYLEDLVTLTVLQPKHPLASALIERHRSLFESAFNKVTDAGRHEDARSLLTGNAQVLDTGYLIERRRKLSEAGLSGGDPSLDERLNTAGERIDSPAPTPDWVSGTLTQLRGLIAAGPGDLSAIAELQRRAADYVLRQTESAIAEERFESARQWTARAHMLAPGHPEIESTSLAIAEAESSAKARRQRERKMAEFDSVKARFVSAVSSSRPEQAESLLDDARALAGEIGTGSEAFHQFFADAYADLAAAYAANEDYLAADRISAAGLGAYPNSERLQSARADYRAELERRALLIALESRFDSLAPVEVESTKKDFAKLKSQFPGRFDNLRSGLAEQRLARLVAYVQAPEFNPVFLGGQMNVFADLFPEKADAARRALGAQAARRVQSEREQDVLAARKTLDELRRILPNDPQLAQLGKALPPAPILAARRMIEAGHLNAAKDVLDAARTELSSLPEFSALERSMAGQRRTAVQKFDAFVSNVKKGLLTTSDARQRAYSEILALWSDNEDFKRVDYVNREPGACLPDLAGNGKLEEGVCYDVVADGVKGPLMVVIPAAGGNTPTFAIGKYEVSVAEFNGYCAETRACARVAAENEKLPVTGIHIKDARGYAEWLSAQASAGSNKPVKYRLPSAEEWRHAAAGGGETPAKGINCKPEGGATLSSGLMRSEGGTLSLGVPIGRALVSATFGGENGWGVVNAVGNAQEWVIESGGLLAKGGAFEDPLAACGIQSNRIHNGGPDAITGFRLLRELE